MKQCEFSSKEFFERFSAVSPWFRQLSSNEIDAVGEYLKPDFIVLDIGCGWGREIKELAPLCKKMVGLDNDLNEIATAKDYLVGVPNVELLVGDITHTDFGDASFDVVFGVGNTLGNLDEAKLISLQEMKRLVKDDGHILLTVYSKEADAERRRSYSQLEIGYAVGDAGEIRFEDGLVSESFSVEELQSLFQQADLKVKVVSLGLGSFLTVASK